MKNSPTQLPIVFSSADYVAVDWAAKAIGISKRKVHYLLEEGELTGHRLCDKGWWRIRKDSVIAYMMKIREQEGFIPGNK